MIYLLLIAIFVAIDHLLKLFVVSTLDVGQSVTLIDGVFDFTYVQNMGAAFGILEGKKELLIIIAGVLILVMFIYMLVHRRRCRPYGYPYRLTNISLSLIIAGGIGNLIDRFLQGYVVDFIQFKVFTFPVFNFADICVVFGAFLLIISVFAGSEKKESAKRKKNYEKNRNAQKRLKEEYEEKDQEIRERIKEERKQGRN